MQLHPGKTNQLAAELAALASRHQHTPKKKPKKGGLQTQPLLKNLSVTCVSSSAATMAEKQKQQQPHVVRTLLAGGVSAACVRTLEAPLERVKLLLQNQNMIGQHNRYSGIIDTLVRVHKEQGLLSFWRGNATNCLRVVPTYALRFTFMDFYQQLATVGYNGRIEDLPLWRQGLSGASAGFTTMLITYPLDLTRTQLAVDTSLTKGKKLYNGMFDCMKQTVQKDGVRGLYKGLLISLLEITPYTAIAMGGYEYFKSNLPEDKEFTSSWRSTLAKLGCGWVAGLCGSLTCYPLDTVKRQMMLDGAVGFKNKYNNRWVE
jgi:solute carrier family 25 (adenine nucleotide translocator) protein 4/5/6/31